MMLCVDQLKSHIPEPITQDPSLKKSGKIQLNLQKLLFKLIHIYTYSCHQEPVQSVFEGLLPTATS